MSEEFGKWLKKNKIDSIQVDDKGNTDDVVSVRALGEWALDKAIPIIHTIYAESGARKYMQFDVIEEYLNDVEFSEPFDSSNVLNMYWEIAVYCLGRAEVERRLKQGAKK